jgi:hypothetical protein
MRSIRYPRITLPHIFKLQPFIHNMLIAENYSSKQIFWYKNNVKLFPFETLKMSAINVEIWFKEYCLLEYNTV